MKDVTFNEIVDEVQNEFPIKVPRFVVKEVLKFALKTIFNNIKVGGNEFHLHYSDLVKIYEVTDGAEVLGRAIDIDETKVIPDKDIRPILRLPYYDLQYRETGVGTKKKISKYRGNRKRKVV